MGLVRFSVSQIGCGKLYFSKNFPCLNFQVFWHKVMYAIPLYFKGLYHLHLCYLFISLKTVICAFSHPFLLALPKVLNLISLFEEPAFSSLVSSPSLMFSISSNPASYLNYILRPTCFMLFELLQMEFSTYVPFQYIQ